MTYFMLPEPSTPHSQRLVHQAQQIVYKAPAEALEIILDGSVARGIADQFSDIELEFFSEQVPPVENIIAWMQSAGFTGKPLLRINEVGQTLLNCHYGGVRVELSWSSFKHEAEQLEGIMDRLGGPQFINEPYKWSGAVSLRNGPHIEQWKALFSQYPGAVCDQYIQPILHEWRSSLNDPIDTLGRWKDAYRRAWFYLLKTHWIDVLPLLRVIFAYNRVWEPVAKWWHIPAATLTHQPRNLIDRVNLIITHPDPVARVNELSLLQIETLELIQADYPVQDLIDGFTAVREYGLKMVDYHS